VLSLQQERRQVPLSSLRAHHVLAAVLRGAQEAGKSCSASGLALASVLTICVATVVSVSLQFDCNGKRDRTKFVGIKKFTDADLSSGTEATARWV
jgi:hypothetical protein